MNNCFADSRIGKPWYGVARRKRMQKLRYMHRNRGLVEKAGGLGLEHFRYLPGEQGIVEIESEWTGRRRERMGMPLRVKIRELPHPSKTSSGGAPSKS